MSFLTVMVEDAEDLDWTAVGAEGVRGHGREFCCLTRLHEDGPLAQLQTGSPREHGEPLSTGMHAEFVLPASSRWIGANLGNGHPVGTPFAGRQQPGRHATRDIALGPDDDVVVIHRFQQLIERGP